MAALETSVSGVLENSLTRVFPGLEQVGTAAAGAHCCCNAAVPWGYRHQMMSELQQRDGGVMCWRDIFTPLVNTLLPSAMPMDGLLLWA